MTMFSSTCGGIHSEKRKGRKSQFLFTAQLLRKTNLAEIFSEARSGTIARTNKKKNYDSHPIPRPFYHGQLGISLTFPPFMHGVKT
jgi:hypothetical protein